MPNSWSRRLLIKERTGAIVAGPVHKVCGMMERTTLCASRLAGAVSLCIVALASGLAVDGAHAEVVKNPIAVFAALDKVTGRISHLEIPLNKTVEFGALKVTPRACYSRAPTEPPKTTSFVEVDETMLDGSQKRIFSGWMFAESPGLNAVEHPVFDVWLTECSQPLRGGVAQKGAPPAEKGQPGASGDPPDDTFRRRPRR